MSKTLTVLPTRKHTATIIFSHGLGDSAAGWYPFAQALAPRFQHVKWVLPTASVQPVSLNGGMPMNSWFDIRTLTPTSSAQEDERGLLQSVRTISDLVAAEVDAGIPAHRIVVGGFSQGAVVSIATGATLERKLAGLISLSGFLMLSDKIKSMQVDHAPSYPVFWGHGTGDPVVRYTWGEMSVKKLREIGWKNIQFESYPVSNSTPKRTPPSPRNRLPALAEVLRRSTRPPVDLYCYYLFLQREGSEDTLDFWLDVQQHENLCRAYFKDLRKSGRTVREDWPRYHELARTRGSIYGGVTGIRRGDDGGEEFHPDSPPSPGVSHRSRKQTFSGSDYGEKGEKRGGSAHFDENRHDAVLWADGDDTRDTQRTPSPRPHTPGTPTYPLSPTLQALYPHDADEQRAKSRRVSTPAQPYIMRDTAISRTDLIASAERIYSRYLMPGADKEVYLPPALRITDFPLSSSTLPAMSHPDFDREADAQARVPDMFHAQKEYVYRAMELDTFPRFLRAKAFGNLTPISALVRLAIGLLALWVGLATGFAFIFLDKQPKPSRLWVIIPFTFAIVNLVAHAYDLEPLLVFMGLSETTPFRTIGIREPYVRKLLFGRALWVTFLSAVTIAVLTVIFVLVPGHRL